MLTITDLAENKGSVDVAGSVAVAAAKNPTSIPAGYVAIELSTKGLVGAPAVFHVRNFNTRDILGLALTEDQDLPAKVVSLLKDLIFEDVDVEAFHENEVVETMVMIYKSFFTPVLKDVDFPWNKEDLEAIKRLYPNSAAEKIAALEKGLWKPKTDINIQAGVSTYDIDKSFKPVATAVQRDTGFTCSFGIPRYGDVLVLKRWLKDNFSDKEKQYSDVVQLAKIRDTMLQRFEDGEDINLSRLPVVDEDRENEYNNLQVAKAAALVDVVRGLHLKSFEGKDVSALPLADRISLVQDPRVDVTVAKELDEYFGSLQFGIKPEVQMLNPITNETCSRRFSFRLVDILQAIQVSSADKYDIVFNG